MMTFFLNHIMMVGAQIYPSANTRKPMNNSFTLRTPMQSIFWSNKDSLARQALFILFGVLLLTIASQLSIPLLPVPLTFQSTAVVLIGMLYGARRGSLVMMIYLLAGACGLPVFAGLSAGLPEFFGPTAGYLCGFIPAAFLSGYLAQNGWGKNIFLCFIAASLGVGIIFALGIAWLSLSVGLQNAIAFGFLPFLVTEPIKLIVVSWLIPRCLKPSTRGN
jgi:biotin transport system substrate-specific component